MHIPIYSMFKENEPTKSTINDPISDPISDPINNLKEIERKIYFEIKAYPGIRKVSLIPMVGKSEATVKRVLKQLSKNNLIEYRGSKKTGGYFIT